MSKEPETVKGEPSSSAEPTVDVSTEFKPLIVRSVKFTQGYVRDSKPL